MSLVFFKRFHTKDEWKEVSYEKALDSVLVDYKDCDAIRDMLTIPNRIRARFATIEVRDVTEDGVKCLMPGLAFLAPLGAEYDDNGKRI